MPVSLSPITPFLGSFLFAEDENAFLPGETHFLYLSAFTEQHCVIIGFGVTIFPAAFAFRHDGLALLHGSSVAVDQETVFTGLQVRFANLSRLRDVNGFADGLRKYRHGQRD